MRGLELLERMGEIDPRYIEGAERTAPPRRRSWPKLLAAAACLYVLVAFGAVLSVPEMTDAWEDMQAQTLFPSRPQQEAAQVSGSAGEDTSAASSAKSRGAAPLQRTPSKRSAAWGNVTPAPNGRIAVALP